MTIDPYTLRPSVVTKDEIELIVPLLRPDGFETRGALLARAFRGRYAAERRCFYLTAARAKKWEILYLGGFSARCTGPDRVWRFIEPNGRILRLDLAIMAARVSTPVMEVA